VTPNGSATAPQPEGGHSIYPSNDHPRDKATFSFRIDAPAGTSAFANGVNVSRRTWRDRAVYTYVQRQPMATELTQIAVGDWDETWRPAVNGIPMRDVTAPALSATVVPDLDAERDHLRWMEDRVSRYPVDLYGSLVVDQSLGFALETQTLSLHDRAWFVDDPRAVWDPVMLHELSHQCSAMTSRPGEPGVGPGPHRVPTGLALRHDHAADAGAPGWHQASAPAGAPALTAAPRLGG
jgi:aminopeptidase N